MTNVTNEIDISKLKKASEIKGRVKDFFSNDELVKLAKNHQCPHFILVNPITQSEIILFNQLELQQWIISNYVKQNKCFVPQTINILNFDYESCKVTPKDNVPKGLVSMRELYILPKHVFQSPPGIYFLCRNNTIVYIGQSINCALRVQAHWANAEKEFDTVYFIPCHVDSLLRVESALIRFFTPEYNATCLGSINREDERVLERLGVVA